MEQSETVTVYGREDLAGLVAHKARVDRSMVRIFADTNRFLEELFRFFYKPGCRLVAAGHATPDVELAAAHADIDLEEALGVSPFSSDVEAVLGAVRSPRDLVYVANPNRVTGTGFSVRDLERVAAAVPQGMLIIDEYYFDYYGVSAFLLADLYSNVLLLRSFTATLAIASSDAGFVLADPGTIELLRDFIPVRPLSTTICKTIVSSLVNDEQLTTNLRALHEEALRSPTIVS